MYTHTHCTKSREKYDVNNYIIYILIRFPFHYVEDTNNGDVTIKYFSN